MSSLRPTSTPSSSRNTQRSTRAPSFPEVTILFAKAAFSGALNAPQNRARDSPAM